MKMEEYMKYLYKTLNMSKYVKKKYARIGEGSMIYSIGHYRFIEMARAAGAVYKINEATGGTVLISLDIFDDYMEQFRENPVPMKNPLWKESKT
jgi:ABC-type Na+ transport system ATPase subunit NatA